MESLCLVSVVDPALASLDLNIWDTFSYHNLQMTCKLLLKLTQISLIYTRQKTFLFREAAKKTFFSGLATKALLPPPPPRA